MKRWLCFLAVILLLLTSVSCASAQSQGILYRVSGGKNEMFLLGSIHVGSPEMYPLGPCITEALEKSDTMVFECDTESTQALQATMRLMSYPMGETLADHVSEETIDLLRKTAEKTGYPMGSLLAMKPWAVVSLLSIESTASEMGTANIQQAMDLGVEKQIANLTKGKEVRYLETAEDQLSIMDGFTPELQEYMLASTCTAILDPESVSQADAALRHWPAWWAEGNAEAFAQNYQESFSTDPEPELMQEYHEGLLLRRNRQMAEKLVKMLEDDGKHSYFVTVGLLHLVLHGESIVHELEKQGYSIEKIMN